MLLLDSVILVQKHANVKDVFFYYYILHSGIIGSNIGKSPIVGVLQTNTPIVIDW